MQEKLYNMLFYQIKSYFTMYVFYLIISTNLIHCNSLMCQIRQRRIKMTTHNALAPLTLNFCLLYSIICVNEQNEIVKYWQVKVHITIGLLRRRNDTINRLLSTKQLSFKDTTKRLQYLTRMTMRKYRNSTMKQWQLIYQLLCQICNFRTSSLAELYIYI